MPRANASRQLLDRPESRDRQSTSRLSWRGLRGVVTLALCLSLGACASTSTPPRHQAPLGQATPPTATLPAPPDRVPVVLVPGITGTALRDRATGQLVWGKGLRIFFPRDGGYAMARSVHLEPGELDRLEPGPVIESLAIGGVARRPIYGPIPDAFEANGYVRGDLASPRPGDTVFLFAYDWRDDNAVSAERLGEQLERLRRARGEARLEVDLLCQSNGAHICRWFAKYGGARLEEAERGGAGLPPTLGVRRLVLAGTANGGALRMLREVDRGREYVPRIGRKMQPETLFGFPAFFQDLPVSGEDLFLDVDGAPLSLDLFDADTWIDAGWAVFAPSARRRIEAANRPDLFGTEEDRRQHLARSLDRAQRFHALLQRDSPAFGATRYGSVQSVYRVTPQRAVIATASADGGRSALWFVGDPELAAFPYAEARASAPGDGHATIDSQNFLSPQERAAMAEEPFLVDDEHFELILHPASLRHILEFLAP